LADDDLAARLEVTPQNRQHHAAVHVMKHRAAQDQVKRIGRRLQQVHILELHVVRYAIQLRPPPSELNQLRRDVDSYDEGAQRGQLRARLAGAAAEVQEPLAGTIATPAQLPVHEILLDDPGVTQRTGSFD